MARINPYDKYREQIAQWNAANPKFAIVYDRLTRTCQTSARPFTLYSVTKAGFRHRIAQYATLETAQKGAEKRADW